MSPQGTVAWQSCGRSAVVMMIVWGIAWRALNSVVLALLLASLVLIQCLIGGTRLLFSLPAYGLIALAGLLATTGGSRVKSGPATPCLVASALLFSYVLIRAVTSPVQYLWWPDFYMVLACLAVYLLTSLYLTGTRQRLIVVIGMLVMALAQVFIGLWQFTRGDNWMPFGFIRPDCGSRASGMFIHPINLAGFLEIMIGFALSLAFWSTWKMGARLLMGYMAVICLLGVAVTGSRGGYGSTAASILTFVALSLVALRRARPERFRKAAIASAVLVTLSLVGSLILMQQSSMLRQRLKLIGKKDVRIYNWMAAVDQFATAPLVGTGAGTHLYLGRKFRRPEIQADPVHAHCDYLELLAEYGIIGGIAMAAFLAGHIRLGLQGYSHLVKDRLAAADDFYEPMRDDAFALQTGALCAVAAYLVHSAVDFNLHIPANALLFAFIFGVIANPEREGMSPMRSAGTIVAIWTLPLLCLLILGAGLPKLPGEYWCEQARVALRKRDYENAIEFATKALEYERRNPELYFHLGEANRGLANSIRARSLRKPFLEAAVTAYRQGLAIFPEDENLWVRLGQVLDERSQFGEAETAYQTAINLDPNLGVLYAFYAAHLNRRGRLEEAEEQLAKGQRLATENLSPIGQSTLPPPEPQGSPAQR